MRAVGIASLLCAFLAAAVVSAQTPRPGQALVAQLQQQLGLSEPQARGAVGALLVYARQRLPATEFSELAARIPNAEQIMSEIKLRGVVNGPLDTLDEYEKTLGNLGIGQPLASQVAPAVLQFLADTGNSQERDILAGIL